MGQERQDGECPPSMERGGRGRGDALKEEATVRVVPVAPGAARDGTDGTELVLLRCRVRCEMRSSRRDSSGRRLVKNRTGGRGEARRRRLQTRLPNPVLAHFDVADTTCMTSTSKQRTEGAR